MEFNKKRELYKLGIRIRKLREEKKYSQETLSFKSGLHRNYISSLELAEKNPSYVTLLKLSNALSINVRDIIPPDDLESIK